MAIDNSTNPPDPNDSGAALRLETVASRLSVGRSTVQRLIREGKLPGYQRIGSNRVYVRADDLERFIAKRAKRTRRVRRDVKVGEVDMTLLLPIAPHDPHADAVSDYVQALCGELLERFTRLATTDALGAIIHLLADVNLAVVKGDDTEFIIRRYRALADELETNARPQLRLVTNAEGAEGSLERIKSEMDAAQRRAVTRVGDAS